MTDRELMQQALEALESSLYPQQKQLQVVTALRSRLAQPEQEPVVHTTGHCENHKQKGGCQLHNLQCGWPDCDRKPITAPQPEQEPVAWRDHVEQRLLTWRQSFVNRSGDQLALDDFMDKQSLDDLVDFVCDEYTTPPQRKPPQFPTMLRKMWSGAEVQKWINENWEQA